MRFPCFLLCVCLVLALPQMVATAVADMPVFRAGEKGR